jgi:hypothetical protein
VRHGAKEERAGDSDELHQQDGSDQGALPDTDLGTIRCRHLDDGLNAIVVNEECQQQEKCIPIASKLAKRLGQPDKGNLDWVFVLALVGFEECRRLRNPPEQRQGEDDPPYRHREECQANGKRRLTFG